MLDEPAIPYIPGMSSLNAKQATFVREYLIDLNATQAAIRAGYNGKHPNNYASELMAQPEVAAAIQEAMDARRQRVELSADYVLRTIIETVERCRQAEPVRNRKGEQVYVETSEGLEVPAFTFDSKGVLKGCELLGRHLSIFNDKLDVNLTDTAQRILESRKRAGRR